MFDAQLFELTAKRMAEQFERGLHCLVGEALLTYCLALELRQANFALDAEVDISEVPECQSSALKAGYVYFDLVATRDDQKSFIETKFLKAGRKDLVSGQMNRAPLNQGRLLNDIARLSLVSEMVGYLVVGRLANVRQPNIKSMATGKALVLWKDEAVCFQHENGEPTNLDMSVGAKQVFRRLLDKPKQVSLKFCPAKGREGDMLAIDVWTVSRS